METYLLAISLKRVRAITPVQRLQFRDSMSLVAPNLDSGDKYAGAWDGLPDAHMTADSVGERLRAAPR
jgi:hypothetical protein